MSLDVITPKEIRRGGGQSTESYQTASKLRDNVIDDLGANDVAIDDGEERQVAARAVAQSQEG